MSDIVAKGDKRPFMTRMLDALMPSLITAAIVGYGNFKLIEFQVTQMSQSITQQAKDIEALKFSIPAIQSQNNQYVTRLDDSLKMLGDINKKMDERITFIERYMLDRSTTRK